MISLEGTDESSLSDGTNKLSIRTVIGQFPLLRSIFRLLRNKTSNFSNPMWPVQQYSKFALATAYFPASNYTAAARRLCRWITNNHDLCKQLKETGYHQRQHHFTARQTALIFEYLGEP
jgi:hypothetical protein